MQQNFEIIMDHSRDIILLIGYRNGRIIEANKAAVSAYGYSREQLLKMTVADLRMVEKEMTAQMDEADARGILFKTMHRRSDGSTFPVEVSAKGADMGGRRVLISVIRDITDHCLEETRRKEAEERLRQSEKRYRRLVETASEGIWQIDNDYRTVYVNERMAELLGCPKEEIVGRHIGEFMEPEEVADVITRMGSSKQRMTETYERQIFRKDGSRVWASVSRTALRDDHGAIIGSFAMFTDISERKRVEQALKQSVQRYRRLVETASEGIWQIDTKLYTVDVNERMARMLGYPKEEIIGRHIGDFIVPEDTADLAYRNANRRRGLTESYERRLRRKDGSTIWTLVSSTPLIDDRDQKILGSFGMFTDITEQKQAEQALKKAHDDLEKRVRERTAKLKKANKTLKRHAANLKRLNQELQEFTFVASHDLQEPLRKIQIFGNLLSQRCRESLAEQDRDHLMRVTGAAERMSKLLRSLLDYSRITRRSTPFERIELAKTVEDVVSDLELKIRESGAVLEIGPLPAIEGDPDQLRQLFQNIISNSIKYKKNAQKPVIKITASVGRGKCRVRIQDNGIGFEERYAERIFLPFQRLFGRDSVYEGIGMGLAICRKVVERHNGCIAAESKPEKGAAFIIDLPIRQDAGKEHERKSPPSWPGLKPKPPSLDFHSSVNESGETTSPFSMA